MRKKTVCFTGHRDIAPMDCLTIKHKLKNTLIKLIHEGYSCFISGGALGFDTLAAQAVLEMRKKYKQIKLILVLPCISQADKWNEQDKRIYEHIKCSANKVIYTSENYFRGCMHKRNRYLVDNSSVCIRYCKKETGGTAYTVDYAQNNKLKIINLATNYSASDD